MGSTHSQYSSELLALGSSVGRVHTAGSVSGVKLSLIILIEQDESLQYATLCKHTWDLKLHVMEQAS